MTSTPATPVAFPPDNAMTLEADERDRIRAAARKAAEGFAPMSAEQAGMVARALRDQATDS